MIRPTFTYERIVVKLSLLKKHPLVDQMGYLKPDDLYISELTDLKILKLPIITQDNYYLTLPDYVEAKKEIGDEEIEVVTINGATINDLLRIVNFESRPWYKASKSLLFKTIRTLQQHLWNTPDGKAWRDTLHGEDINSIIGQLVGYSGSTVSNIKYIGERDYSLLEMIDDPDVDMTLTRARFLIEQGEAMDKKKDNYSKLSEDDINDDQGEIEHDEDEEEFMDGESMSTSVTKNCKPSKRKAEKEVAPNIGFDAVLKGFSVSFGKYGDYTLDLSTGEAVMLLNDAFVGVVSINPEKSNNINEKVHFIMQNADEGWSFHVTGTRIGKLLKKQEVSCKPE